MSDTDQTTLSAADQELAILKERADVLGVPYKSNIGLDTLRERVRMTVEKDPTPDAAADAAVVPGSPKVESLQDVRERIQAECLALIRVRIANMNPAKADLDGELITVASKFLGTITKLIPFGKASDAGYHLPKVVYDDLVGRQFQQVFLRKNNRGLEEVQTRLVPEYSIQILPPLTTQELAELALQQQAAERLGA